VKAETKTDTPKEEQKNEEAVEPGARAGAHCSSASESIRSKQASVTVSEDKEESSSKMLAANGSETIVDVHEYVRRLGPTITADNPLILTGVKAGGMDLRHGALSLEEL